MYMLLFFLYSTKNTIFLIKKGKSRKYKFFQSRYNETKQSFVHSFVVHKTWLMAMPSYIKYMIFNNGFLVFLLFCFVAALLLVSGLWALGNCYFLSFNNIIFSRIQFHFYSSASYLVFMLCFSI